jgi:membrane protein implicated in regulation of membrane protease activity
MERTTTAALLNYMGRGQWIGAGTAAAMVGLAVFAIIHAQPWVAGTAITSTAGLVALFLSKRRKPSKATKDEGGEDKGHDE